MKAKVVSFIGPTDTADLATHLSLLTIIHNHSYSDTSRTTWLIKAVPTDNRNIAQNNFAYWSHKRVLSMEPSI